MDLFKLATSAESSYILQRRVTARLENFFPFCYCCTFLKRCDRLRSVPFYYRSPFRFITILRFVSFAACV